MTDSTRTPTPIDTIADAWVDSLAELEPVVATYIGRTEYNDRFGDLSPAGHEKLADAARSTLSSLRAATPTDDIDVVTQDDLSRELELMLEVHEARWALRDLNVIASPAQEIRSAFDLMPTDTADDWSTISTRLSAVSGALEGYMQTLSEGISQGITPARRQVREVVTQVARYSDPEGFFASFAAGAAPKEGALPDSLTRDLARHADEARSAYVKLGEFLSNTLAPAATEQDGVGREHYALHSRRFLGATIDLDETYEWGVEELARMVAEQESIANEILPGASVTELGKTHFDIAEPIRNLECMIAPTQEGGIYYTGPTDDFSRPGRMWWSVPEGVTEFDTWRELTTVYHEGVPGHHLQIAQAVYNRGQLNSWRRLLGGTSGHAEGWALYAERLMEQLGYLDDPADRLGMLDGQRMRAARVVLDIGVHLGKQRPDGKGVWDADYALEFMLRNVNMPDEFVKFEVNRYLGWPGQAPSYKVGQRIWEQLRDDVAAREGADFSIKAFHKRALDIGGVGLDTLRAALSR
jgi:uncharacterized protein (DUF885 family)